VHGEFLPNGKEEVSRPAEPALLSQGKFSHTTFIGMGRTIMKKIIVGVIGLSLVWSVSPVAAQDRDEAQRKSISVPYARVTPVIDGVLSAGEWDDAATDTVSLDQKAFYGDGNNLWDGPEDGRFQYWVKYDDKFVYFGVSVKDDIYISQNYGEQQRWSLDPVWENDAVEYFFDGDLSRSETRNDSELGGQFILGLGTEPANTARVSIPADILMEGDYAWKTIVNESTGDWAQEAKFALAIIGNPNPQWNIGFDINVDDVDRHDPQTRDPEFTDYLELRDTQMYWEAFPHPYGAVVNAQGTENKEHMWGTMIMLPQGAAVRDWEII